MSDRAQVMRKRGPAKLRRSTPGWLWATPALLLLLASACSASTPAAQSPEPLGAGLTPFEGPPDSHDAKTPLPRYFTIELNGEGVLAMGSKVDRATLSELSAREARDSANLGAAVAITADVPREQVTAIVDMLLDAGFAHLVLSSRQGMLTKLAASSPQASTAVADTTAAAAPETSNTLTEPPVATQGVDNPTQVEIPNDIAPDSPPVPQNVEVKEMGVHIGGGPNTTEAHAVYAGPIASRFDEFKRCYPLAQGPRRNSSFGVDLLISSRGGTAKIKDYRTALGGKDFHLCVLGVFGTIEFPAPERSTMVSYSLLFKPL